MQDNDDTHKNYTLPLVKFLAAVCRSQNGHASGYRLYLTDTQKQLVAKLCDELYDGSSVSQATLHACIYGLIGEPNPGIQANQWKCPVTAWLAISSVQEDGTFVHARHYTPILAQWAYIMRCVHLRQALLRQHEYDTEFHG